MACMFCTSTKSKKISKSKFIYSRKSVHNSVRLFPCLGPPGVLGILGEGLFIFRELGSTANYLRGAGEQAHTCTFGDLGSTAKK